MSFASAPCETLPPRVSRLGPEQLVKLAVDLASQSVEGWRSLVRHDSDQRWFLLIEQTALFDVWLIGWGANQGVDLHDHGGCSGALCVVDGLLVETFADPLRPRELSRRHLLRGHAWGFGPGHIHDVTNPGPAPATSIHVYSPPLSSMAFYDWKPDSSQLRQTRTETIDEPGADSAGSFRWA